MYQIADKVAVVTGGTRGIGLAIANALLQNGAKAVVNGRTATPEAEALIGKHGKSRVAFEAGDVSLPEQVTALIDQAAKRFGGIDILVHSAGGPVPGKIMDLSPEKWMQAFAVHLHPVFHLFRAAHPYLAKQGGAVLLISSVAGLRGCPATVAYQTVKGALIPMARALAFDHAAEGIRVNVLAPGIIRTRFHNAMTETARAHNIANRIPLRREGSVDDVASAALELIRNDFVTGEVMTIDGGMAMRVTG
jgi:NAD(P)-dependent dehydrogenase (short-subunit alcohol dehydrogenase family)